MADAPWYKDGLAFTCTQCGNCCTGAEGVVWVNQEEQQQIADFIGKSIGAMKLEHTRLVGRRTSLKEFANGDCTFFDGQARKCTIYSVRPRQCRTWPFWDSNLDTPEDWESLKATCPGIDQGKLHQIEHIEAQKAVIHI